MRYPALSVVACAALVAIGCETEGDAPSLIPAPEHLEMRAGEFSLDDGSELAVSDATDGELVQLAALVGEEIRAATGLRLPSGEGDSGQILLTIDPAVTSAAVTTYVPTSVHVPAGATSAHGVVPAVGVINGSVTVTFVRFAVPALVAVIVYVNVSPTDTSPEPSSSAFDGAGLSTDNSGDVNVTVSSSVTTAV